MMLRTCLICDNHRERGSLYCKQCQIYEQYKDTDWYKELMKMQHIQSKINRRERFPLLIEHPANLDGSPVRENIGLSRPAGRPRKYDDILIQKIRELYKQHGGKIPVRTFTRMINDLGIEISRETVRKIMRATNDN